MWCFISHLLVTYHTFVTQLQAKSPSQLCFVQRPQHSDHVYKLFYLSLQFYMHGIDRKLKIMWYHLHNSRYFCALVCAGKVTHSAHFRWRLAELWKLSQQGVVVKYVTTLYIYMLAICVYTSDLYSNLVYVYLCSGHCTLYNRTLNSWSFTVCFAATVWN